MRTVFGVNWMPDLLVWGLRLGQLWRRCTENQGKAWYDEIVAIVEI